MSPKSLVCRFAVAALAVGLIGGCSSVTSGNGQPKSSAAGSNNPTFPTTTVVPSAPVVPTASPTTPAPTTVMPTTAAPPVTTPAATTAPPRVTKSYAEVRDELEALTNGEASGIVAVGTRYEAITYDEGGNLQFWSYLSQWHQAGSSTYPYDGSTPPDVSLQAGVLTGMNHAIYIVRGNFSGDGSGNAVSYTAGAAGWGAVKAEANGNIGPSGQGVTFGGIGLSDDLYFVDGQLETADCSANLPIASCGGNSRVLKYWRWTGTDFALAARAGLPN
jgi:hypothetical protein